MSITFVATKFAESRKKFELAIVSTLLSTHELKSTLFSSSMRIGPMKDEERGHSFTDIDHRPRRETLSRPKWRRIFTSPTYKLLFIDSKNGKLMDYRLFVCLFVCWFVFYGISTLVGYLMPNPFYTYISNINDL